MAHHYIKEELQPLLPKFIQAVNVLTATKFETETLYTAASLLDDSVLEVHEALKKITYLETRIRLLEKQKQQMEDEYLSKISELQLQIKGG